MTETRFSRPGDEPSLKALWQTVFGDSDEYLKLFFGTVYRPGMAAVAEINGTVVSAAYAVPMKNTVYIFAVATLPEFRGRGLGKAVTLAAADGKPAYLYPAEVSLRGWYSREMGAETMSFRPLAAPLPPEARSITAEEYDRLREQLLAGTDHVRYSPEMLRLFGFAGKFYEADGRIFAAEGQNVRECLPCEMSREPFIMGLNGAGPMYWGLVFD